MSELEEDHKVAFFLFSVAASCMASENFVQSVIPNLMVTTIPLSLEHADGELP